MRPHERIRAGAGKPHERDHTGTRIRARMKVKVFIICLSNNRLHIFPTTLYFRASYLQTLRTNIFY